MPGENMPPIYSYSQLQSYRGCSMRYKHYYIDKYKLREVNGYTELGSLVHECIERFYKGEFPSVPDAFKPVMSQYLTKLGLQSWRNELEAISDVLKDLLLRASAAYRGPDAIRTGNGDVPKNPAMTSAWKKELERHNLNHRIDLCNASCVRQLPEEWANVKMVDVYTQVDHLTRTYTHPAILAEVNAIEFGFSIPVYGDPNSPDPEKQEDSILNLARLPSGRVFRGFIDLVGKDHLGRWVIIDHKTSSGEPPTVLKVAHHEQLLLYAYFWHQLTGVWPAKIGISHLRSGTTVCADVDTTLAERAAQRHDLIVNAIDKKVFIKHAPFEYGSPCLSKDCSLEDCCPYISVCHREVARALGWVDPDEQGVGHEEY